MCNHKRNFFPPLSQRPKIDGRTLTASDIICVRCVEEDRSRFYETLRQKAEAERLSKRK